MPRKKNITFWACDFETSVWGKKVENEKGKKIVGHDYGDDDGAWYGDQRISGRAHST